VKRFRLTDPPEKRSIALFGAGLPAALCLSLAATAHAAPAAKTAEARLHAAWRASISSAALPGKGCFTAAYPSTAWSPVACTTAPHRLLLPAHGPSGFVVGNGNDYAAETATTISSAVASFPSIKGLKSETNDGSSNTYSLQLNSSYYISPVCQSAQDPANCRAWMQFAYSNPGGAFMEVWLIDYGFTCPSGWGQYVNDCVLNSNQVNVPTQTLAELADIQVSGAAVAGGNDTVKLTTSSKAYAVTMEDSVIDLAQGWNTAEYNIFGDGGGSQADFNTGTKITIKIQLKDGSTSAPVCENDGFTLETNNLGLDGCKAAGGKKPSISFTESN
jgi:hypothetical protein